MIKYNSYKELLFVLQSLKYYFTFKNPAYNINLDYSTGDKTKVRIEFEYDTRAIRMHPETSKKIKQELKKEKTK